MIKNWRDTFGQGDFPFLIVQIAPYEAIVREPSDSVWAEIRDAQLFVSQQVPKTALVVTTDVGDEKDIHPRRKEPVGARLALAARAIAYGETIEYSGPMYDSMSVDGDKAILRFKHVGSGLVAKDGPLTGFTVAGEDKKFHAATADDRGRYGRGDLRQSGQAGRGALRLGRLSGREPVEPRRPARLAVPHRRFSDHDSGQEVTPRQKHRLSNFISRRPAGASRR